MAEETKKTTMIEESPGVTSIMRVALMGVVAVTLGLMIVPNLAMIVQSFIKGTPIALVDVPAGIMGVFSAMVIGKAVQSFGERK
jgi:hypothetical protein